MISVIIPVYNTWRFLPQCVRSVLNQTVGDLEVILVNDASTDDSLAVCRHFVQKDSRIKLVNKARNEGVDRARFSGLKEANGEYVMFVDSDDWLEGTTILAEMLEIAQKTNADYVQMQMQKVLDRFVWVKKKGSATLAGLLTSPELFDKYYVSFFGYNILSVSVCGKMYRKEVLDKASLSPSGLAMGEDLYFNLMLFPHLNSIYILDKIGYNYRFGGMTTRYNPHLLPDLKYLFKIKDRLIEKYNYWKAYDLIRIELKNVFRSDICQLLRYHKGSRTEIMDIINAELQDPIYDEVGKVNRDHPFHEEPFSQALMNKDAGIIYELCDAMVKKDQWKQWLKRCASGILKYV